MQDKLMRQLTPCTPYYLHSFLPLPLTDWGKLSCLMKIPKALTPPPPQQGPQLNEPIIVWGPLVYFHCICCKIAHIYGLIKNPKF